MSLRNIEEIHVVDLPPERVQYMDEGCEFAQSCLNCHLPVCVYDEPAGKLHLLKKQRSEDIVRLYAGGKTVAELAQIFGVSTRTVQRDLKKAAIIPTPFPSSHEQRERDSMGEGRVEGETPHL